MGSLSAPNASEYWLSHLRGARAATFPPPAKSPGERAPRFMRRSIQLPGYPDISITKATVIRAAWAIVLGRHCDTDDICFGSTVSFPEGSGRIASHEHGPSFAAIPTRLHLDASRTVDQFLKDVQLRASSTMTHEKFGLKNICQLNQEIEETCRFTSLLITQSSNATENGSRPLAFPPALEDYQRSPQAEGLQSLSLMLQTDISADETVLSFTYDSRAVSRLHVTAIANQIEHVIHELISRSYSKLGEVSLTSGWDVQFALSTNKDMPDIVDSTFHQLVAEQARSRPTATAIRAWDGILSYEELNTKANYLAHHLLRHCGVKLGDFVHVCFEKSLWHFVSILAINKAGGAWVPLDPAHPPQRLQQIAQETGAKLTLSSSSNTKLCKRVSGNVLEVSSGFVHRLATKGEKSGTDPEVEVRPKDIAYVLFTSGSTGASKALVMEHGSAMTSQAGVMKRIGINPGVSMLQFAAFGSGLSVGEIVGTLTHGATLRVPAESDRMGNISKFIREHNVTWAFLTPTVARTLSPATMPSLEGLALYGEPVTRDIFDLWFGKVRLLNAWAAAETCGTSSIYEWKSATESPSTIGAPLGDLCWLVEPGNPNKLAPLGTLGELAIQGPSLMRDYLGDPIRTSGSFIRELPDWVPYRDNPMWSRLFLTGDLCYYNADGKLEFSGRKDTQIRVRGLRVESGDIEHQIMSNLRDICQVAVDAITTKQGTNLISYLCFSKDLRSCGTYSDEEMFLPTKLSLSRSLEALVDKLNTVLPRHMVPTFFIPCAFMPLSTSAKLDRQSLRRVTSALTKQQLAQYTLREGDVQPCKTPMEFRVRRLWATTLGLPLDSIGRNTSFFKIGGDSTSAIRFVRKARDQGMPITAKDMFRDPRLSSVAAQAGQPPKSDSKADVEPFELIKSAAFEFVRSSAALEELNLPSGSVIEDAYPCTTLQEGFLALSIRQPESYIATFAFKLPSHLDSERFKHAWEYVVRSCANLRTRIITTDENTTLQVIVRDDIQWEAISGHTFVTYIRSLKCVTMSYGDRLSKYALVEEGSGDRYFIWTGHHAIFDGWTRSLMFQMLRNFYKKSAPLVLRPYSGFIKYVLGKDTNKAAQFWRTQLDGAKQTTFPLSPSKHTMRKTKTHRVQLKFLESGRTDITKATIVKAAWALILARYCETDDVCFASAVSGRQAPVEGITNMPGPAVAVVPVRMQLDYKMSASAFLQKMQAQATGSIEHEQFGLQNIQGLSPEIKAACEFSSLLVIQPLQVISTGVDDGSDGFLESVDLADYDVQDTMDGYFTYPIVVQALVSETSVELLVIHDETLVPDSRVQALSHHFEHVISQLSPRSGRPLGQVSVSGPWDLEQAIAYNHHSPELVDSCFHTLVEQRAALQPNAPAIFAWDGELTYAQLNEAANRLAHYLVDERNVRTGEVVHTCFGKTKWHFVSILAVNKAGAAWSPLDPAYPVERLRSIVSQTKATVGICSSSNVQLCADLLEYVVKVDQELDQRLGTREEHSLCCPDVRVSTDDPLYVLFTSGSTGVPKGFVMEHRAVVTSQTAIADRLSVPLEGLRMLQFAAYVFDMAIAEIVSPLMLGGCICIPSDQDRTDDLAKFMRTARVNWAWLTPSFIRSLDPNDVPALEGLVLAGEALSRDIIETWAREVHLWNAWGPAETCVANTLHEVKDISESPLKIGSPVGGHCWIVDPENSRRLAPIGTVGEVLIQGPTLLREYISNPEKTRAALIRPPSWTPNQSAPWNRAYKSGDLAAYNFDGTLEFVSRKDSQVKIRGQRVELGDVEHHVRTALDGVQHVAAAVLNADSATLLCCFVTFIGDFDGSDVGSDIIAPLTRELRSRLRALSSHLGKVLPTYMVPALYLPCNRMPFVTSTKIDHKRLNSVLASLSPEDIAYYSLGDEDKTPPETELHSHMRRMWAAVLCMQETSIGIDDNFFKVGGDSIKVIKLSKKIQQEQGVKLGASLLNTSRATIRAMSSFVEDTQQGKPTDSYLPKLDLVAEINSQLVPLLKEPLRALLARPTVHPKVSSTVFLTGATGYLGSEILHHLLTSTTTRKVVALVRASSLNNALQRVAKMGLVMGWWNDKLEEKLEIWLGDLAAANLGLTEHQWSRLCGLSKSETAIDAIVHNGAVVNWNEGYEQMAPANIDSSMELLRISMTSPMEPRYVFISGGAKIDKDADVASMAPTLASVTGYAQTKWVPEQAIYRIAKILPTAQNRISIIKPGRVIGSPESGGVANLDDYIWRVFGASIALGVYPTGPQENWLCASDVGSIADGVMHNLSTAGAVEPFDDIQIGIPVTTFWEIVNQELREQGASECKPLPWDSWLERASSHCDEVGESSPLHAIQTFLVAFGWADVPDVVQDHAVTERLKAALKSNIRYILKSGYIELFTGGTKELGDNVVSRSSAVMVSQVSF